MELLNNDEHLVCFLYQENDPLIIYEELKKTECLQKTKFCNQIIFLLKGKIRLSYEYQIDRIFEEETFLIFPREHMYIMSVEEDSSIVVVNLHPRLNFCTHFSLEMLYEYNKDMSYKFGYSLKINEMIADYLNNIVKAFSGGLKCSHFHRLKQQEILFYLRAYYSREELTLFFAPILNNDIHFANTIYENYESIKNIGELANLTNYSLSGFKKRFMKIFGMSPQNWLTKEKAIKVYFEINCSKKTFKEITNKYNFSSAAHFNKFCQKAYGISPSLLRENTKKKVTLNDHVP